MTQRPERPGALPLLGNCRTLHHTPTMVARFLIALGSKVLNAWSLTAKALARRHSAAHTLISIARRAQERSALEHWRSQTAARSIKRRRVLAALGHHYNTFLRSNFKAWARLVIGRRRLQRAASLLYIDHRTTALSTAWRLWRRRTADFRESTLRHLQLTVWFRAAPRRCRLRLACGIRDVCLMAHQSTKYRACV